MRPSQERQRNRIKWVGARLLTHCPHLEEEQAIRLANVCCEQVLKCQRRPLITKEQGLLDEKNKRGNGNGEGSNTVLVSLLK